MPRVPCLQKVISRQQIVTQEVREQNFEVRNMRQSTSDFSPRRMKSGCEAAMTYGWRSHFAFNDDSDRATAAVGRSWEQVLNLIVSATTQEGSWGWSSHQGFTSSREGRADWRATIFTDHLHDRVNCQSWGSYNNYMYIYIYARRTSCLVIRAEARC